MGINTIRVQILGTWQTFENSGELKAYLDEFNSSLVRSRGRPLPPEEVVRIYESAGLGELAADVAEREIGDWRAVRAHEHNRDYSAAANLARRTSKSWAERILRRGISFYHGQKRWDMCRLYAEEIGDEEAAERFRQYYKEEEDRWIHSGDC